MDFLSKHHGILEYDEKDIVTFEKGIPGFEGLHKYILVKHKDNEVFSILHSLEDEELGFIVILPFVIDENYEFKLEDDVISKLKLKKSEDALILNIVTLNSDVKKITVNLKGPIVINIENNLAHQVIINNDKYSVKTKLFKNN